MITNELIEYAKETKWRWGEEHNHFYQQKGKYKTVVISPANLIDFYQNRQEYAQKYAEKIIGKDYPIEPMKDCDKVKIQNKLRNKQRKLNNKLKGRL